MEFRQCDERVPLIYCQSRYCLPREVSSDTFMALT